MVKLFIPLITLTVIVAFALGAPASEDKTESVAVANVPEKKDGDLQTASSFVGYGYGYPGGLYGGYGGYGGYGYGIPFYGGYGGGYGGYGGYGGGFGGYGGYGYGYGFPSYGGYYG